MNAEPIVSKPGLYEVFETENGRLIVLDGLDQNDLPAPHALDVFLHNHLDSIAALYWFLFAGTLIYVWAHYIGTPLLTRYRSCTQTK